MIKFIIYDKRVHIMNNPLRSPRLIYDFCYLVLIWTKKKLAEIAKNTQTVL